ncbi:dihydrofolate reductase [Dipodascopsis tothii]|uniref:dihydrofolate reductase n=1 Tax=Dipodascopsis tothii TaxID=44089 RepID=UPI0034D001F8
MPPSLTLVVAATSRDLGIGAAHGLPWRLPPDMAFFKAVTLGAGTATGGRRNAVLMGRTTYASIPPRFRPLADRINVVLSRSADADASLSSAPDTHVFSSFPSALEYLDSRSDAGDVFVVGGGQIYDQALRLDCTKRVLLTYVSEASPSTPPIVCDTFLPDFRVGNLGAWVRRDAASLHAYLASIGAEAAQALVPADASPREHNGLQYEFTLWERE